jgi:E3 ubiquitin-protein ligase UBR7
LEQRAGDTRSCTHALGPATQPVYACLTCSDNGKEPFGFCLGCNLECHLECEVVELYNKRSFQCDCGRAGAKCTLCPEKRKTNNVYNHNYQGLYCYCDGQFMPEDTMLSCMVCQDWFHDRCLQVC